MPGNVDVVIIRGAPGVGKSSAGKLLARRLPAGVTIEVDRIRSMFHSVNWTDQSQHIASLRVAADMACRFLDDGAGPVVIVDTFSGDKTKAFVEQLMTRRPEIRFKVFALHASSDALRHRIEGRPDGDFKDFRIAALINKDVLIHTYPGELLVETSDMQVAEVVERIHGSLYGQSGLDS